MEIRNITIIAHVDHGKTTLVDKILTAANAFGGKEQVERVMDSMDLEKERGITIRAKKTHPSITKARRSTSLTRRATQTLAARWNAFCPWQNCSLILVDAFEGPMPQTRFVSGQESETRPSPQSL
jgi:GTP-binding protein